MSKRAHLINEIVYTERLYANDLALVRDAYLYRLRPSSQHSTVSTGASKHGGLSPDSRHTAYTFETAGTSATSSESLVRMSSSGMKGSAESGPRALADFGTTSPASSSLADKGKSSEEANGRRPAVLKAADILSPADIKAIFLNIEQLAAFSSELATSFQNALGDGSGMEPIITEHASTVEVVVDRLGTVFQKAVSLKRRLLRLDPLLTWVQCHVDSTDTLVIYLLLLSVRAGQRSSRGGDARSSTCAGAKCLLGNRPTIHAFLGFGVDADQTSTTHHEVPHAFQGALGRDHSCAS